jgi:hypothetical protein
MAVWDTAYTTFSARPLLSIPCGSSKFISPCNLSFGKEVLGYMEEGLTSVESECYHNTEYVDTE